jgi:hypothetical protein
MGILSNKVRVGDVRRLAPHLHAIIERSRELPIFTQSMADYRVLVVYMIAFT